MRAVLETLCFHTPVISCCSKVFERLYNAHIDSIDLKQ